MHILDLSGIYPNEIFASEGRSVSALNRALVRTGTKVTTIVLRPWAPQWLATRSRRYRHLAVAKGPRDDHGVEVIFTHYPRLPRLPERWRGEINAWLQARHAIRIAGKTGHRFDLVHAQGLPTAVPAAHVAQTLGLPLAVTLRDDLRHLDDKGLGPLPKRVFKTGKAFFAIGLQLERDAPRFFPQPPPELVLAPNGIDFDEIDRAASQCPERPAEFRGRILAVGHLYHLKGFHLMIRALAKIRDKGQVPWHATIIGEGPYRGDLESLILELQLQDHVQLTGRLPLPDVLAHMRSADLFCLPSWREAFGNVFAEAAVCSLPAIGCSGNGPELIIEHDKTGLLVPPQDIDALTDALTELLKDPKRCRAMGQTARQRIRRFSWERTASLYIETYQRLLSEAKR